MVRMLFVRLGGALGAMALAVIFIGLIPFIGAEPSVGAGFSAKTPALVVDRTFKGDRLPMPAEINKAVSRGEPDAREGSGMPKDVPVGCDSAFSPVASPRLAYYFGRCAT
ncbi:MAG: hypothetical protein WAL80_23710 [Xanthobacteraceae bacterium]